MKNLAFLCILAITVSGCSSLGLLSSFAGGGPSVSASVQTGGTSESNQALSQVDNSATTNVESGRDTITNNETSAVATSGSVDSISVMNTDIPFYVIVLIILGWILPSPAEMYREFLRIITFGRYKG